jgi:hypothetical protein
MRIYFRIGWDREPYRAAFGLGLVYRTQDQPRGPFRFFRFETHLPNILRHQGRPASLARTPPDGSRRVLDWCRAPPC